MTSRAAPSAKRKPTPSSSPFAPPDARGGPELQKVRAYDRILMDIILGELPPGGQLDEDELAERYGEGLAALRDALGRLALEGMVARRPRAGTFVSPLDLVELNHEYEARQLIEPECAALAAVNGTADDIHAVLDAFAAGPSAARAQDWRALVRMDLRFHAAVARASHNSSLEQVLIPLQYKAARFWIYSSRTASEEAHLNSVLAHQEVAAKIARRDAEGARAAVLAVLGSPPIRF